MNRKIFLDAGHSINIAGAITKFGKEHNFNVGIRDELKEELKKMENYISVQKGKIAVIGGVGGIIGAVIILIIKSNL